MAASNLFPLLAGSDEEFVHFISLFCLGFAPAQSNVPTGWSGGRKAPFKEKRPRKHKQTHKKKSPEPKGEQK